MTRVTFNNFLVVTAPDSGSIRLVRTRFYTVGEVSALLRVSQATVWNWLRAGKLRAVQYGEGGPVRIRGDQIVAFLRPYVAKSVRGQPPQRKKPGPTPRYRVARRLPKAP